MKLKKIIKFKLKIIKKKKRNLDDKIKKDQNSERFLIYVNQLPFISCKVHMINVAIIVPS